MQSRKSEVKAFRLDSELVKGIKIAAKREGLSENAFVKNLLLTRVKADRLIHAIPCIVLSKQSFISIIGMSNPDGLEMVGFDTGRRNFALIRELYESSGMELGFLQYLQDVLGAQAHWFEFEGVNNGAERITLRHEYGKKWSLFLKSYLAAAYQIVSPDTIRTSVADTYVSLSLSKTPR